MLSHRHNQTSTKRMFLLLFILSVVAMYFVFAPVIHIPFYHHDIYKFAWGGWDVSCGKEKESIYNLSLEMVRPITAYLDCFDFHVGNTLEKMSLLRMACAILVGLLMSIVAFSLYSVELAFWPAFLVAGAIFCLPLLQTVMIMGASFLIFALGMALLSNYFISKCQFSNKRNLLHSLPALVCGLAALFASLFTYPAMTSIFLLPVFARVLFMPLLEWRETRSKVVRDIIIYVMCSVIFLLIVKYIQAAHASGNNYEITVDVFKLRGLYRSLSMFWNIDAGLKQAIVVDVIIILGCIAGLRNYFGSKNILIGTLIQAVIVAFGLMLMGGSVYILAPMSDQVLGVPVGVPFGRVIFVFQAMSILLLFWSLINISKFFTRHKENLTFASALILFFFGAYFANYIVTLSALNDYAELNFVTTSIAERITSVGQPLKRIHIIGPTVSNFTGLPLHEDIYNSYSTIYADDTSHIIKAALLRIARKRTVILTDCVGSALAIDFPGPNAELRCIQSIPKNSIAVTYSHVNEPIYSSPDTLFINMNTMAPLVQAKIDLQQVIK